MRQLRKGKQIIHGQEAIGFRNQQRQGRAVALRLCRRKGRAGGFNGGDGAGELKPARCVGLSHERRRQCSQGKQEGGCLHNSIILADLPLPSREMFILLNRCPRKPIAAHFRDLTFADGAGSLGHGDDG